MINCKKSFWLLLFSLFFTFLVQSQPSVNFILPDSTCIGSPINITNLTTGGTTYYWNFCSGNANENPSGVNIGNPGGLLNIPTYMTLARDGNNCYSFVSCQGAGIIRLYHGNTFNHNPITWTNLGTFGLLGANIEGIQVKLDNGSWYGFVCNDNTIVRLNFGNSLSNTPTATDIGPFPMLNMAHGLGIIKEGNTWLGFVACTIAGILVRFNFGNSLANIPTAQNLGNLAGWIQPGAVCIVNENSLWYILITSGSENSLYRVYFGTSLLNTPTGQNLGNPGGFSSVGGLTIIRDCDLTSGYFVNYLTNGQLGKLNFPNGVSGTVIGQVLGNIGNLNKPHSFSEIFRQNDTLFAYVTNRGSNTLTRLLFPPCNNSSIPSSTQYNPPPFSYNQPGTYNIRLLVDENLPDQVSLCKTIVVGPDPSVNLGPDRTICAGNTVSLDAGAGFSSYLWSTGATTRTLSVSTPGSYWVRVTKTGCIASDTVHVYYYPPVIVNLGPDTTLCQGQTITFNAGSCSGCTYLWGNLTTGQPNIGTGQTYTTGTQGLYTVTVTDTHGCSNSDTVNLTVVPHPVITTFPLSDTMCSLQTTNITLTSTVSGSTYFWTATLISGNISGFTNGSGNIINQILTNNDTVPGIVRYTLFAQYNGCISTGVQFFQVVNPSPIILNSPLTRSICSNSPFNLALLSNISGTTFIWTANNSSGLISGYSNGSGNVINQILINNSYIDQTVIYHIIPVIDNCTGTPVDYFVTVKPLPDLAITPPSLTLCSNNTTNITLISQVAGTTFSWTATGSSSNVSGFSPGNGNLIQQNLINTGFACEQVTYHVTSMANGCAGQSSDYIVPVAPVPDIYFVPGTQNLCSGQNTQISLFSHVATTSFSWTATGSSSNVSGFSAGNGNLIQQNLINTGFAIEQVTYHVTSMANGCAGQSSDYIVSVAPVPDIYFVPAAQNLCSGQNTQISLFSHVANTIYSWTATGSSSNVTGFSPGNGNLIQQNLINTGFAIEQVTYHVTSMANGCAGQSSDYIVPVAPIPDIYFVPAAQNLCSGQNTQMSIFSHVANASFSWTATGSSTNVTGYVSGTGDVIQQTLVNTSFIPEYVSYFVTPEINGCPGSMDTMIVTVRPVPAVTFNLCTDSVTTMNAQPFILRGGLPLGGTYTGPGVNSLTGLFTPSIAGTGKKSISYTFSNAFACSNSSFQTLRIVNTIPFICGENLVDVRDGQGYPTVILGTQCWMAANLNFGRTIFSSQVQRNNCIVEKYCFNDNPIQCNNLGGLYQWDELMSYEDSTFRKGVCPPGWHVPSESDWNVLFSFYLNNAFAASPLLYTGYSGFNAFLSGGRYINKSWNYIGFATMMWTSSSHGPIKAWAHGMNSYDHGVSYYPSSRSNALPIRCIKD